MHWLRNSIFSFKKNLKHEIIGIRDQSPRGKGEIGDRFGIPEKAAEASSNYKIEIDVGIIDQNEKLGE